MVPDFEAIERVLRPRKRPPTNWSEACIGAARDIGFEISEELNDGDLHGVLGDEWLNYEGDRARARGPRLHRRGEA